MSYASVIPGVKLPRAVAGGFDYAIPDGLRPAVRRGSWVRMAWRGRLTDGIVAAVREYADIAASKALPISDFIGRVPEEWVDAIEWVAERTFVSAGTALHAFLPRSLHRSAAATAEPWLPQTAVREPTREIVRISSAESRADAVISRCEAALASGRSAVVVVPHASDLALAARLRERLGASRIVEFHGALTEPRKRAAWLRMLSSPAVVIGTRLASMAPCPDIGAYLVVECDSPDLRQYDQNPRYDSREVALFRANLGRADIAYIGHAPRMEEYALTREGFSLEEQDAEPKSVVTSARPGAGVKDEALVESAVAALRDGKKVLMFHNRRGSAGAVICGDCGCVRRCPNCAIAFVVHGADTLLCHRCGATEPVPASCPSCGGPSLRRIGLGTESLAAALTAKFPQARVRRVDADIADDGNAGETDILVGTQLLLHEVAELKTPELGLIIASSLDDLLMRPGFRTRESAWATVRKLKDTAFAAGCPLMLRTADGEDAKIRALLMPLRDIAAIELEERQSAGYPPFGELIAVHAFGASEREANAKASALKTTLAAAASGARFVGPLKPHSPFVRGRWKSTIAVFTRSITHGLRDALRALDDDCIIERNPEALT